MITIRPEVPADLAAIHSVTAAAFNREVEAQLIDNLRDAGHLLLSLVALADGRVVGHVAFSPGRVVLSMGDQFEVAALGPISVAPGVQQEGIGSQLMERGSAECLALGHELIFLLGHPAYYSRFGFVPAKPLGVRWAPDTTDHPNPAWMVKELREGALAARLRGQPAVFHYSPAFDNV